MRSWLSTNRCFDTKRGVISALFKPQLAPFSPSTFLEAAAARFLIKIYLLLSVFKGGTKPPLLSSQMTLSEVLSIRREYVWGQLLAHDPFTLYIIQVT